MSALSSNLPLIIKEKIVNSVENKAAVKQNNAPVGNNLNRAFSNITVHNVLSENSNLNIDDSGTTQNTIIRKIKDFGMFGAVNNVLNKQEYITTYQNNAMRKWSLSEPQLNDENKQPKVQLKMAVKKPRAVKNSMKKQSRESNEKIKTNMKQTALEISPKKIALQIRSVGTPGRKGLPLPQAVARRNARERNRVKQVNKGFAALRNRIPEEVSEAYDVQGNMRSNSKKLSKVETLRMAVDYIRSLERLLGYDFPRTETTSSSSTSSFSSAKDSFILIKDEFDIIDEHFDDSQNNYDIDNETYTTSLQIPDWQKERNLSLNLLPYMTTLNGLKYIRIPGTNTYELLTPEVFESNADPITKPINYEENYLNTSGSESMTGTSMRSPRLGISAEPASFKNILTTPIKDASETSKATKPKLKIMKKTFPNGDSNKCSITKQISKEHEQQEIPKCEDTTLGILSLHNQQECVPSLLDEEVPATTTTESKLSITPATVPPVVSVNELLLQTCTNTEQLVASAGTTEMIEVTIENVQAIKQEYNTTEFSSTSFHCGPLLIKTQDPIKNLDFSQPNHQHQIQITPFLKTGTQQYKHIKLSPNNLPVFHEQDHTSFYEGEDYLKKEFNDILLDTSATTGGLSDESIIDATDWWEAHTPKSDIVNIVL